MGDLEARMVGHVESALEWRGCVSENFRKLYVGSTEAHLRIQNCGKNQKDFSD